MDDSSPSESKNKSDQKSEKKEGALTKDKDINNKSNSITKSQHSTDIRHISGTLNSDDLYALPNKRKNCDNASKVYEIGSDEEDGIGNHLDNEDDDDCDEEKGKRESIDGIEDKDRDKDLPYGWEKHEGNAAFIYIIWYFLYFTLCF